MKKILCTLALLAIVVPVFAQEVEKTEYTAYIGETTVNNQSSYTPDFKFDGTNRKVRNVILLIGDGMGLAAVNAVPTAMSAPSLTIISPPTLPHPVLHTLAARKQITAFSAKIRTRRTSPTSPSVWLLWASHAEWFLPII